MAKLNAKKRKALPKSSFAIPSMRAYPIHDKAHARAALAYSKRKNTKGSYSTVRAAVAKRYPDMVKKTSAKKKTSSRGRKRSSTGRRRRG